MAIPIHRASISARAASSFPQPPIPIIGIFYIFSKQMTADEFIKALDKEKFIKFHEMIGMAGSIAAEWDTGGSTGWFLGFTPENFENIQKNKNNQKKAGKWTH